MIEELSGPAKDSINDETCELMEPYLTVQESWFSVEAAKRLSMALLSL
jgi:hypothetical protein